MLSAYVCRQCRARLSQRIHPVRLPQWHRRANSTSTFTSLRPRRNQDDAQPPRDEPQTPVEGQQEIPEEVDLGGPRIRTYLDGQVRGRYSRLAGNETGDALPDTNNRGRPRWRSEATLDQGFASRIEEQLKLRDIDEAWRLFEKTYTSRDCKALADPPAGDVELLTDGKIFTRLLGAVNKRYFETNTDAVVTPTTALFRYEQLGISQPEHWWRTSLLRLTHHIISASEATSEGSRRDLSSLHQELLSVWRLFFQRYGPSDDPLESINPEWQLPTKENLPHTFTTYNFIYRLSGYCPKFLVNPALGFCAVYLYNSSSTWSAELQQQAAPFVRLLDRLLADASVNGVYKHTTISSDFKELPDDTRERLLQEIHRAPRTAKASIATTGQLVDPDVNSGDAAADLEAFYYKRMNRAIVSKPSAAALDMLWKEVEEHYVARGETGTIPRKLYNQFLSGYLIVSAPKRSVEVWNHMIKHGLQPDMRTWNSLLHGCAAGEDLNGLNATWTRMMSTGIEPDVYAWTTRINGLMVLATVNHALSALDEMAKRWMSAETASNNLKTRHKGPKSPRSSQAVNTCTKPSIEVINGAISAIVQKRSERMPYRRRIEHVQKLLAWSTHFQIRPNAITYNNLIRLYMQVGDSKTAHRILQQMEKDGIQGDITTNNMLITAAFDNGSFDHLSAEEQKTRILSIYDELEANGMTLNEIVYSSAIDRLLKDYSNYTAVIALMAHMTERNLAPAAHTYTSFITHYFQADPPNIRAVDALVHYIFNNKRAHGDKVLYDRLIEGYARYNEVGSMMAVLVRMSKLGLQPGWDALTSAIQSLVRNADYDRARMVVRDVERGEGVAKGGIVGVNHGQNNFWHAVERLGLGADEENMGQSMRKGSLVDNWQHGQEPESVGYEQEPGSVQYDQDPANVQYEQQQPHEAEPGAVPTEQEQEDVHGFVSNDPEVESKRQQQQ